MYILKYSEQIRVSSYFAIQTRRSSNNIWSPPDELVELPGVPNVWSSAGQSHAGACWPAGSSPRTWPKLRWVGERWVVTGYPTIGGGNQCRPPVASFSKSWLLRWQRIVSLGSDQVSIEKPVRNVVFHQVHVHDLSPFQLPWVELCRPFVVEIGRGIIITRRYIIQRKFKGWNSHSRSQGSVRFLPLPGSLDWWDFEQLQGDATTSSSNSYYPPWN